MSDSRVPLQASRHTQAERERLNELTQSERERQKNELMLAALGTVREANRRPAPTKNTWNRRVFKGAMDGARMEPWGGASAQLQVSILDTNGDEVPAEQCPVPIWADANSAFGRMVLKKKRMSSGEAPSRQHTGRSSDSTADVGTGR